jgi:glycogen(starch) synthase
LVIKRTRTATRYPVDGPRTGKADAGMHVLRITSVFEAPPGSWCGAGGRLDPVGGMQSHTGSLTRALDGAGVAQDVVTAYRRGAAFREPLGERATVWRVGLPVRAARQLWAPPAAALAMRLAHRADVVHAHMGEDLAALPIALSAARARRIPLVVTLHLSMARTGRPTGLGDRAVQRLGALVERRATAAATGVLVLTRRTAMHVIDAGIDPVRVRVIPSGVPEDLFAGELADPLPHGPRPRVVFVGRLAAQKDPLTLVEAVARMRSAAEIVVVGDGPQRDAVERRIAQLGLGRRIRLVGFVSRRDVARHLAHADVLALPSRYEELGTALVEAMAGGVPVVASRTGGIPEVVDHGRTGLLVTPGDAGALADALDALLADPARRRAMGAAARERAGAYRWSDLAAQVLAAYDAAVGGRGRPLRSPPEAVPAATPP